MTRPGSSCTRARAWKGGQIRCWGNIMRGTFGARVRLRLVQELQKAVLPVGAQCAVKGAEQREGERFYVCGFAKLAALEVQLREAVLQQPSIAEVLASGAGVRRNPSVGGRKQ